MPVRFAWMACLGSYRHKYLCSLPEWFAWMAGGPLPLQGTPPPLHLHSFVGARAAHLAALLAAYFVVGNMCATASGLSSLPL